MGSRTWPGAAFAAVLALTVTGCGAPAPAGTPPGAQTSTAPPTASDTPPSGTAPGSSPAAPPPPVWVVGARPLPKRADGFGQVLPTPPELAQRLLPTKDLLPPPTDGSFHGTVAAVPPEVLRRSTWDPACPVAATDLRYLTLTFLGFDGRPHTGELLVHASVAEGVRRVFEQLYAAQFPLEEMRVTSRAELDLPPTGDGNNTNAFVCRPARGQTRWSAHAKGLAVDINPFNNPYLKGDLVLPELASAYVDRAQRKPGMVRAGDPVVRAFTAIGWTWGGTWRSPKDLMHFSSTGD
ncbi:hypothetical protein JOF53_005996 [Crossiella equi]|uniref:Peptidase M15C domain-containing protein n=2 Tax=Crossiella equi TaxID=130796 RepID=A0ABS5AKM7_9PSEU|nr:M15 family metallopeptidase [Crossiella equi]MBP2477124.1 hypothetical protein [Crossiella equi]